MKVLAFLDFDLARDKWKKFAEDIRALGYNVYYTRHGDEGDWVTPVSVKDSPVLVNRCGWCVANFKMVFQETAPFPNEIDIEKAEEQAEKVIIDEVVRTIEEVKQIMEGDEK